jgi:hypothetical protein
VAQWLGPDWRNDSESHGDFIGIGNGYVDGFRLGMNTVEEAIFPSTLLSEKERKKLKDEMMQGRELNLPESGIAVGQLILIFKNYAEKHPEKLNGTARICLFEALAESYGWK